MRADLCTALEMRAEVQVKARARSEGEKRCTQTLEAAVSGPVSASLTSKCARMGWAAHVRQTSTGAHIRTVHDMDSFSVLINLQSFYLFIRLDLFVSFVVPARTQFCVPRIQMEPNLRGSLHQQHLRVSRPTAVLDVADATAHPAHLHALIIVLTFLGRGKHVALPVHEVVVLLEPVACMCACVCTSEFHTNGACGQCAQQHECGV